MDRPRLFLSAVSREFRTARTAVAATVRTLGYDCVSQDDFPTGHGELREWLRAQIDSCQGLLQIVGAAYGAEPPEADPDFGRVSYTQVEFLYARRQGKKTWLVFAGEHCQRDRPSAELDLPEDPGHPDPAGYQAQRRGLQQEYVARLRREDHLWYPADSPTELENVVLRLRDDLSELRRRWERRHRRLTGAVGAILLALLLLGGGVWWGLHRLWGQAQQTAEEIHETHQQQEQIIEGVREAAAVTTAKIRAHLVEAIEEAHRRELAEADKAKDWKERQRLREAADAAYEAKKKRIDELAASFAEIEGRGQATTVFQELTRILAEQGVDQAIAYVESRRSDILKAVDARAAAAREANRAQLQPLLKAAGLQAARGRAGAARELYAQVLAREPDWPVALHACFWFLCDQGDAARIRATLADARREYEQAERLAQRLAAAEPKNTEWQRDLSVSYEKLGDVAMAQGKLDDAARYHGEALAIAKKLAAADPTNTQWQRDLSVSYVRLGGVAMAQGKLDDAARHYGDALAIAKKLAAADPANTEWQRDLSVSYSKLGDVAMAQGKLDDAARYYGDALAIAEKLAAADPTNTQWQRDLSVSYERLGIVARAQAKLDDAARYYGDGLAIRKKLAAADPTNTEWQRDLWVSYWKLAKLAERRGSADEARGYWKQALEVLEAMDRRGLHLSPADRKVLAELRKKVGGDKAEKKL